LSKDGIIRVAAELVARQGWNATGINQILTESETPKGSFYYYFQSKDELGVAIVRHHGEVFRERRHQTMLNGAFSGAEGIRRYFTGEFELQRANGWRYGCPVGSLANETAQTIPKISQACRDVMRQLEEDLEKTIARGQKDGSVRNLRDSRSIAGMALAAWQGALLQMKLLESEAPLVAALGWFFETLI
jgi:TetR/AcrR family transcriptional repressor of nem operon